MEYNFREIEKKWQQRWVERKTYKVVEDESKKKFYVLNMFPYPSGAGLHVGHPLGYIASDIYARYKRLQGFNVLNPMGYDAYGLPAEQYAIQTGQHPAVTTAANIARYREQLDKIGFSFDWDREVRTCEPGYYHWTQWAFQKMFNSFYCNSCQKAQPISKLIAHFEVEGTKGLDVACSEELNFTAEEWKAKTEKEQQEILMNYRIAYLGNTMVNWCPDLGTVLANDEVVDGVSERGGYPVIQKVMRQWCLRVSAYAQRLLDGLDTVEWTESLKETQRNWIGRSEGAEMQFKVKDSDIEFTIFTTRADTVFGVTFMVLAPESELVAQLTTPAQQAEVDAYLERTKQRTDRERIAARSVSGVFSGSYAINPLTNEAIPVWISDYVLAGYGTGAIMAVPAHDSRDYAFAKHFGLEIRPLIEGCDISEESFDAKEGIMMNSPRPGTPEGGLVLNGLTVKEAIAKTKEYIKTTGLGRVKVNFRLRDAIFSRQRYWGEPSPLVNCPKCGWVPVPEEELPLVLPQVDSYELTDDGESPLSKMTDWVNTKCPKCGCDAKRETDTMPQWAGSSWYFLRYMDPHNDHEPVSHEAEQYWGPVDWYNGGMEHTTLHLLYSRFWHKFLYDIGVVHTKEPYAKRTSHGMILGQNPHYVGNVSTQEEKDALIAKYGNQALRPAVKMSKSLGNVVNPDDVVKAYGADTMRLYIMFIGDFEKVATWSDDAVKGCKRFLDRVWNLADQVTEEDGVSEKNAPIVHKTIKKVTDDIDTLKMNTAIAALMAMVNEFYSNGLSRGDFEALLLMLSPFAPHMVEELWEQKGFAAKYEGKMAMQCAWPEYDESKTVASSVEMAVQVSGKFKGTIIVPVDSDQDTVVEAAKASEKVAKAIAGMQIVKVIHVKNKLVNLIVKPC